MLARGLVAVAFVVFFVSLIFQSVPAAVGGVGIAFLAFVAAHFDRRHTKQ